jgi:hypothetical protein
MLEKTKEQARNAALNALLNNKERLDKFAGKLEQIYQVLNWKWRDGVPKKQEILEEIKCQIKYMLEFGDRASVESGGIRTSVLSKRLDNDLWQWEATVQFDYSIYEWRAFESDQDVTNA